jgi:6-phosphogluconate dehydrogenase (decarboxylating)
MIGLGRMGANMVRRLIKDGHQCVVFARMLSAMRFGFGGHLEKTADKKL